MIGEQSFQVDACAIATALVRHRTGLKERPVGFGHCLLDRLLEYRFLCLALLDVGPYRNQIGEHRRQVTVIREINSASGSWIETP